MKWWRGKCRYSHIRYDENSEPDKERFIYESDCGLILTFAGRLFPGLNDFKYCPKCGKKIPNKYDEDGKGYID